MNVRQSKQGSIRTFLVALMMTVIVGVLVLVLWSRNDRRADVSDARQVTTGQQLYTARCAACHGTNLEGQPNWKEELPGGGRPAPPHDASGHTWHHADQLLFVIVKQGGQAVASEGYNSRMPGFGKILSDDEIWAVLAYIKSTWPPDIQALQAQIDAQERGR